MEEIEMRDDEDDKKSLFDLIFDGQDIKERLESLMSEEWTPKGTIHK